MIKEAKKYVAINEIIIEDDMVIHTGFYGLDPLWHLQYFKTLKNTF